MRILLSALACAGLAGCVSETVRSGGERRVLLEWPANLDSGFLSMGTYHNVELLFEINPRTDIPPGQEYWSYLIPAVDGPREIYTILELHEVVYVAGEYEVGGFRYPAPLARRRREGGRSPLLHDPPRETAALYVFKKRRGNLEFVFRGQRIVIKTRRHWTPSVYYSSQRGKDDSGPWVGETVKVGLATIELSSRSRWWSVNGEAYEPDTRKDLVLTGAVDFDRS